MDYLITSNNTKDYKELKDISTEYSALEIFKTHLRMERENNRFFKNDYYSLWRTNSKKDINTKLKRKILITKEYTNMWEE